MRKGELGSEETAAGLDQMQGPYKRSKFLAEQIALEFARGGFPVVIVNPTAPIGDHDFRPTPTGKIVVDFLRGAMPAFVDTGLNVVDVADVARGHWAAFERGRVGERYILGGENLTLQQILGKLAEVTGKPAADSVRGGLCRGRGFDRLGSDDRQGADGAARCGPHGAQENVGAARQSRARAGIFSRPGRQRAEESSRMVSSERLL
jgi:nucleoside-diphosphate-sugar epimerase